MLDCSVLGEDHYRVLIPDDGLSSRKIRVHKPAFRKYTVLVNGAETPVEAFGDYLTFYTGEQELEIFIRKDGIPAAFPAAAAAAAVILLSAALILKKKKKMK